MPSRRAALGVRRVGRLWTRLDDNERRTCGLIRVRRSDARSYATLSSGKPLGWPRKPPRGPLPCRGPFLLTHARRIAGRTPAAKATPGGEHAQQQPAPPQAPREGGPPQARGQARRTVLARRASLVRPRSRARRRPRGMRRVTRYPKARTSSASGPSSRDRLLSAPMPTSSVTGNRDGKHAGKAARLRVTRLRRGLVGG